MRSRFALLWLRNAAALYAGSFTVIELALGAADTSLRSLTTFWGFVFVLWLHSVACIGAGLLLTHLLAGIDRAGCRREIDVTRFSSLPVVTGQQGRLAGTAREHGAAVARVVYPCADLDQRIGTVARMMQSAANDPRDIYVVDFVHGFTDELLVAHAERQGACR